MIRDSGSMPGYTDQHLPPAHGGRDIARTAIQISACSAVTVAAESLKPLGGRREVHTRAKSSACLGLAAVGAIPV
eukprot:scaffold434_cov358-Prasinococcus_capsulatus_cf.AAC.12